jgi:serine-aspartate repeat-containing protein C/D/E
MAAVSPVLDGSGNAITTTTDADGRYRFTGLVPGDYRVEVLSDNFTLGGPLFGYLSSDDRGTTPNDDLDEQADENGIDDDTPLLNGIRSLTLTLEPGWRTDYRQYGRSER